MRSREENEDDDEDDDGGRGGGDDDDERGPRVPERDARPRARQPRDMWDQTWTGSRERGELYSC